MRNFLILTEASPITAEKTLRTQPQQMCANGTKEIKTRFAFMKLDVVCQVYVWGES